MASTTESDSKSLRGRDEFYKETYRFFDVLGKNTTLVAVIAALLVGAGVVGGILANRHEAKSEAGKNALFLAEKSYDTELKALAGVKPPTPESAAKPLDGKDAKDAKAPADPAAIKAKEAADKAKREADAAGEKKMEELAYDKLDVDAKFPETVKKYQEVISQYPGTRAGHEARMSLGTLYFNHGDSAKAVPLFQTAADSAPGSLEKSLALQSLGYALENTAKYPEAIAAYEKAVNLGEAGNKGDLLLAIARDQSAMHDATKARSTYDQILSQLPNSDAAKTAEALKAKL